MIDYRFRVPSATFFTLYSYSKGLKYRLRLLTKLPFLLLYGGFRHPVLESEFPGRGGVHHRQRSRSWNHGVATGALPTGP
jgi:hypothetical protein